MLTNRNLLIGWVFDATGTITSHGVDQARLYMEVTLRNGMKISIMPDK